MKRAALRPGPESAGAATATGCEFRALAAGDDGVLAALARDCYVPYYAHLWAPGAMQAYLAATYEPARVAAELRDPNVRFELASLAGTAVALSKLVLRHDRAGLPNAAYLERVYVAPGVLGRGVGRALVARACEAAEAAGRESIWLRAMASSQRPIASYQAAGFVACGAESFDGPGMLDAERPMLVMTKHLVPRC